MALDSPAVTRVLRFLGCAEWLPALIAQALVKLWPSMRSLHRRRACQVGWNHVLIGSI